MIEQINQLIAKFGEITGSAYTPRQSYMAQCQARLWLEEGFTLDDLKVVAAFRKANTEEPFRSNMLKWSYLIGRVDRFGEDLAEAKARLKPKRTNRDAVLQVTGRPTEKPQPEARTAAQIASECSILRKFLEENK